MTDFTSWKDFGPRTRSRNHSISLSTNVLLQTNYSLLSSVKVAKEKVYVSQPPCCVVPGKEEYVYMLFKALYGLKQAPRAWNEKMERQQGFIRSHADYNLYYKS